MRCTRHRLPPFAHKTRKLGYPPHTEGLRTAMPFLTREPVQYKISNPYKSPRNSDQRNSQASLRVVLGWRLCNNHKCSFAQHS